jgi:hypothetical protein
MCKRTRQHENTIYADIDNPQKVSLFDYFRSIELIPLETSSNVLMKSISRLVDHQGRYYALDKPQAIVFVFDRDGNCLFKIDKKGKGPGEYSSIEDILINPFTDRLEILTAYGFVHEYDLSGDFIETKRISYPDFRAVHQFVAVDSNIHVFYSMFQPRKIIYFTLDDQKLLHEEFEESQQIGSFGYDNLYSYNDEWYFFRPFHPCVYKVGKKQLEEVFRFDFGKYTREGTKAVFSEETRHGLKKLGEEAFAQFPYWIRKLGHNNRYVLAQVPWGDVSDRSYVVYDKSVREGKFIPNFTEQVEFEPDIVTDDCVLSWCNRSELEKRITKEMLDDGQKEIFEKLLQSGMETNPILIKYHFK